MTKGDEYNAVAYLIPVALLVKALGLPPDASLKSILNTLEELRANLPFCPHGRRPDTQCPECHK